MVPKSSFFESESSVEVHRNRRRTFLRLALGTVVGTKVAPLLRSQPQESDNTSVRMFEGFKSHQIKTTGATINVVSGGQGPPPAAPARQP